MRTLHCGFRTVCRFHFLERRHCIGYFDITFLDHQCSSLTSHEGDKSNHVPSLHIPQVYYFLGFATLFGWIPLLGGPKGPLGLLKDVGCRMFGTKLYVSEAENIAICLLPFRRTLTSIVLSALIAITVHFFTYVLSFYL